MTYSFIAEVSDPLGLHSRPAGEIVILARTVDFSIQIGLPGQQKVSALSPLSLMALKAKPGSSLEIEVDTQDENKAKAVFIKLKEILNAK